MAKSTGAKVANKKRNKKFGREKGKRAKLVKSLGGKDAVQAMIAKKTEASNKRNTMKTDEKETATDNGDAEFEIMQEDLEDIEQFSFLCQSNFDTNRKSKLKANQQKEELYEKQPRKVQHDEEMDKHVLLPIKSKDGVISRSLSQLTAGEKCVQDDVDNEEPPDNNKTITLPQAPPPVLSTAEIFARRNKKILEKKTLIAQLCGSILENPEENITKLKELNKLCEETDKEIQITVKKLALLSLLQVYKDIIPGYRIRTLTEEERNLKVSKDVKNLRASEAALLINYQKYLSILEKTVEGWLNVQKRQQKIEKKNQTLSSGQITFESALQGQSIVAMQCMCDLLSSAPHFNYRTNLITVIVQRMNNDPSQDRQISKMCCETVKNVFLTDLSAEISLEIVQVLTKMVKNKGYRVDACVLECLLSLKIRETDLTVADNNNTEEKRQHYKGKNKEDKLRKMKMSKKDKKRQKDLKVLEHELKETEAVENKNRVRKMHTEIIKLVFATYFRILKHASHSPLLSSALEGLSKFAHLINVDFFMDLMNVLQSIMASQELNHKQSLYCVLTAFKILSGQGEALNIDPRGFYCCLYKTLLHVHAGHTSDNMPTVLQCMDVMLNKRKRQISVPRTMGFIKRLCTTSLQLLPHSSLAALACVRSFLQFHQRTESLLESESLGSGVFLPELDDPENSNAENTALWELALLSHHFHPTVRTYSSHIAGGAPSQGVGSLSTDMSRMKPLEIFSRFSFDKGQLYPAMAPPKQQKTSNKKRHSSTSLKEECHQQNMAKKVKRTLELTEKLETLEFPVKPRIRRKYKPTPLQITT